MTFFLIALGILALGLGTWAFVPLFTRPTIKAWRYCVGCLCLFTVAFVSLSLMQMY